MKAVTSSRKSWPWPINPRPFCKWNLKELQLILNPLLDFTLSKSSVSQVSLRVDAHHSHCVSCLTLKLCYHVRQCYSMSKSDGLVEHSQTWAVDQTWGLLLVCWHHSLPDGWWRCHSWTCGSWTPPWQRPQPQAAWCWLLSWPW